MTIQLYYDYTVILWLYNLVQLHYLTIFFHIPRFRCWHCSSVSWFRFPRRTFSCGVSSCRLLFPCILPISLLLFIVIFSTSRAVWFPPIRCLQQYETLQLTDVPTEPVSSEFFYTLRDNHPVNSNFIN